MSLRANDSGKEGRKNGSEDSVGPWNETHRGEDGEDPAQHDMEKREVGQAAIGSPVEYTDIAESGLVFSTSLLVENRRGRPKGSEKTGVMEVNAARIRKTLRKGEGGLSVNVNGVRVMFTEDDVVDVARAWVEQS